MKQIKTARKPREAWSIDLIPSLPETPNGNKTILLAVDNFTGYIQCWALPSKTSKNIIQALRDNLFMNFGIPKTIRSDEEAGIFNSKEFKNFMDSNGIFLHYTSVASPQSNGIAERNIQTIKSAMRKILSQERNSDKWDESLFKIVLKHNSSISTYGRSPEELMFATPINQKSDLIDVSVDDLTPEKYFDLVHKKTETERQQVQANIDKIAQKNQTYRNIHRSLKRFKLGMLVLHRQLQVSTGGAGALKPLHTGPYSIIKLNQDGSTALCQHLRNNDVIKAHFNNLQLLYHDPRKARMAQKDLDQLLDKFFASKDVPNKPKFQRSMQPSIQTLDEDERDGANGVDRVISPPPNTSTNQSQSTQNNESTNNNVNRKINGRTAIIMPSIFRRQPQPQHFVEPNSDAATASTSTTTTTTTRSGRVTKKPKRFE
jgi:hypothetical protein